MSGIILNPDAVGNPDENPRVQLFATPPGVPAPTRSCPTCHSTGARRVVLTAPTGYVPMPSYCHDSWHDQTGPSATVSAQEAETVPEATPDPYTVAAEAALNLGYPVVGYRAEDRKRHIAHQAAGWVKDPAFRDAVDAVLALREAEVTRLRENNQRLRGYVEEHRQRILNIADETLAAHEPAGEPSQLRIDPDTADPDALRAEVRRLDLRLRWAHHHADGDATASLIATVALADSRCEAEAERDRLRAELAHSEELREEVTREAWKLIGAQRAELAGYDLEAFERQRQAIERVRTCLDEEIAWQREHYADGSDKTGLGRLIGMEDARRSILAALDADPDTDEEFTTPDIGTVDTDTAAIVARATGGGIRSRDLPVEFADEVSGNPHIEPTGEGIRTSPGGALLPGDSFEHVADEAIETASRLNRRYGSESFGRTIDELRRRHDALVFETYPEPTPSDTRSLGQRRDEEEPDANA